MAILGIDEVGRGPLAGPLVVGAVILSEDQEDWAKELKDSKKITKKKREVLSEQILKNALATGLGWVSAAELDNIGISAALKLATKKAVKAVQKLHTPFSQIVVDGKVNFLAGTKLENYVSTMPKADALIREVSAASIIAKVARDNYMTRLAKVYPEYGFDSNAGYGTAKHMAALSKFGICPEHRQSFEPIKSMVGFSRPETVVKNTTALGAKGESVVAKYLIRDGHEIIARNHKTKFAEIDIISVKSDKIYFTEVKYRRSDVHGSGLAAITPQKQSQMRFAAESFLKLRQDLADYSPLLAVASVAGDDFHFETWFTIDS